MVDFFPLNGTAWKAFWHISFVDTDAPYTTLPKRITNPWHVASPLYYVPSMPEFCGYPNRPRKFRAVFMPTLNADAVKKFVSSKAGINYKPPSKRPSLVSIQGWHVSRARTPAVTWERVHQRSIQ